MRLVHRRAVSRAAVLALLVGAATAVTAAPAAAVLSVKPAQQWGTDGRVSAILPVGNRVFVGGEFSNVVDPAGHSFPAAHLAWMDPATGVLKPFGGGTDGPVTALATAGSKLYVGGAFTRVGSDARWHLAALDLSTGNLDPSWAPSTDQPVDAIVTTPTSTYVSGAFTTVNGSTAHAFVAKLDGAGAALDPAWAPAPDARVRAMALSGVTLYLGGDFKNLAGSPAAHTAAVAVDGAGAAQSGYVGGPTTPSGSFPVLSLDTDANHVYVGAGGIGGGACTALDAGTGAMVWSQPTNGDVQAVHASGGLVYCGGHFSASVINPVSFGNVARDKLAAVTTGGTIDLAFAPRANSALGVFALSAAPAHLYAGGDFTLVEGVATQHVADFVDTAAQTAPLAPTLVSATAGDGVVHLAWDPPSSDGGSPIDFYLVYRRPSASVPLVRVPTGRTYDDTTVTNGTTYTYKVAAHNRVPGIGTGPTSAELSATPAPATAPGAPTGTQASAGDGSALVSWTAPASDGGAPITGYTLTASPAGGSVTMTGATSASVTGLANGTAYTFTVAATNSAGTGPASAPSAAVVPMAPPPPPPPPPVAPPPTADSTAPKAVFTSAPPANSNARTVLVSFTATDPDNAAADLKFRCTVDSGTAARCVSPLLLSNLAEGTHTLTVRAVDPAGNGSGPLTATWRVDVTAPLAVAGAPKAPLTTAGAIPVAWTGADTGSGIANFDVRYARSAWNSAFGAWHYPAAWQHTTHTSLTAGAAAGYNYCFSVRARDAARNVGAWTAPRCSARALDDRALAAGKGWTRRTSKVSTGASGYYGKTYTATTRAGAVLTRTSVRTSRLALVATRCKTCGVVGVYLGGKRLTKVDLHAKTTQRRALITLPRFSLRKTTVTIKVLSSGRGVQIDGLATSRS